MKWLSRWFKTNGERVLCPWHLEKTPSCHVNRKEGKYLCFGCGRSGPLSELWAALVKARN